MSLLAGRMLRLLRTRLPKLGLHQLSHEAQGGSPQPGTHTQYFMGAQTPLPKVCPTPQGQPWQGRGEAGLVPRLTPGGPAKGQAGRPRAAPQEPWLGVEPAIDCQHLPSGGGSLAAGTGLGVLS